MRTRVPRLRNDEEAEAFLEGDLSNLDYSQFERVEFRRTPQDVEVNIRLPEDIVIRLQEKAKAQGISYEAYIRDVLTKTLSDVKS